MIGSCFELDFGMILEDVEVRVNGGWVVLFVDGEFGISFGRVFDRVDGGFLGFEFGGGVEDKVVVYIEGGVWWVCFVYGKVVGGDLGGDIVDEWCLC